MHSQIIYSQCLPMVNYRLRSYSTELLLSSDDRAVIIGASTPAPSTLHLMSLRSKYQHSLIDYNLLRDQVVRSEGDTSRPKCSMHPSDSLTTVVSIARRCPSIICSLPWADFERVSQRLCSLCGFPIDVVCGDLAR
jgi:hypothetical protein